MGARIEISTVGDKYDDRNLAPFLGRYFQYEITRGALWENHAPFLTPAEAQLLEAPYFKSFEDEPAPAPVDPAELARVLLKVKDYLWTHQDSLPYEIHLDYERMKREGLPTDIINHSRCWIHGDLLYHSSPWCTFPVTERQMLITNFPHDPNDVDLVVDIKERIEIEGRTYYLTRTNRHEVFAPVLDQVIAFCNEASRIGEQVYWLYSH
ncbi:hypothetical protein GCM10027048_04200 [Hymenobacter coalescens]